MRYLLFILQILVVYNFTTSLLSVLLLVGFSHGIYEADSSFEKKTSAILHPTFRLYWYAKILELLDTVFMVLRHKGRQITFLHIYHHSSMLLLSDICYHHYPWVAMAPYLALNSAVHVMLYLYYGLSALYPDNPPQWKKFMTQFQIVQFVIDMMHALVGYLYHGYCIYGIFYGITMIGLFSNFYYVAYVKRKGPKSNSNGVHVTNGYVQKSGSKKNE